MKEEEQANKIKQSNKGALAEKHPKPWKIAEKWPCFGLLTTKTTNIKQPQKTKTKPTAKKEWLWKVADNSEQKPKHTALTDAQQMAWNHYKIG